MFNVNGLSVDVDGMTLLTRLECKWNSIITFNKTCE